jgi:hypothetical protein
MLTRARRVHDFWTRTRMLTTLVMLSGNIFSISVICVGDYRTRIRPASETIFAITFVIIRL